MVTIDSLLPSRTVFSDRTPLNVLLVANNPKPELCRRIFRFYADDGSGWREIFAQEKELEPNGHSHLYFQLPARCFGPAFWDAQPDELTLCAAFSPPEHDGGVLLYYDPNPHDLQT